MAGRVHLGLVGAYWWDWSRQKKKKEGIFFSVSLHVHVLFCLGFVSFWLGEWVIHMFKVEGLDPVPLDAFLLWGYTMSRRDGNYG